MISYNAYTLAFIYAQSWSNHTYIGLLGFFLHPESNSKCFKTPRQHHCLDFDAGLMQFERQSVYTSNC